MMGNCFESYKKKFFKKPEIIPPYHLPQNNFWMMPLPASPPPLPLLPIIHPRIIKLKEEETRWIFNDHDDLVIWKIAEFIDKEMLEKHNQQMENIRKKYSSNNSSTTSSS